MFDRLTALPIDPIMALMAVYEDDTNPNKINLGVGVYKDSQGRTPILEAVKQAEQSFLRHEDTKTYVGLAGDLGFNRRLQSLLFGESAGLLAKRVRTVQTPGGTGALRVAAEFVRQCRDSATIWVSTPTWDNHKQVFQHAGLRIAEYPYYDYDHQGLQWSDMTAALSRVQAGDVVLLHACCHNPSGMDLTEAQWHEVAALAKAQRFTPMLDIAYQGLGEGLDEDARGIRILAETLPQLLICSSCSKNFGLYRDRVGALTLMAPDADQADIAYSVALNMSCGMYAMPPAHGAAVVHTILCSDELTTLWRNELAVMRTRINSVRKLLAEKLTAARVPGDFSFIQRQFGLFSFLSMKPESLARLRQTYSIYLLDSGRMNITGINDRNIDYFASAVAHCSS